jgi:hypothetical protein
MSDGQDHRAVGLERIDERIAELPQQAPPDARQDLLGGFGVLQDECLDAVDLIEEPPAQTPRL